MLSRALAFSGALIAGALVAVGTFGCGGDGRNASATTEATPVTTGGVVETTTSAGTTTTGTAPADTATATTPSTTSTPAATTPTRTETAPESGSASGGGLAGATSAVNRQGYAVPSTGTYKPDTTLRVLVGVRQGAGDGKAQKAFFFLGDRFLGTDTAEPSAQVSVAAQDDTSVTLRYALYRKGDGSCCPSGGHADVQFALDQGKLAPMGDIPPADAGAAVSRR